jgi:hypothetical protein
MQSCCGSPTSACLNPGEPEMAFKPVHAAAQRTATRASKTEGPLLCPSGIEK